MWRLCEWPSTMHTAFSSTFDTAGATALSHHCNHHTSVLLWTCKLMPHPGLCTMWDVCIRISSYSWFNSRTKFTTWGQKPLQIGSTFQISHTQQYGIIRLSLLLLLSSCVGHLTLDLLYFRQLRLSCPDQWVRCHLLLSLSHNDLCCSTHTSTHYCMCYSARDSRRHFKALWRRSRSK